MKRRLGALLCSALCAPTFAQLPAPPRTPTVDENGVDVRTGNPVFERTELQIGPADERGLKLVRYFSGGVTRDSFDSTYHDIRTNDIPYQATTATLGSAGDTFGMFGVAPGASISMDYDTSPIWQEKDGTKVRFGLSIWDQFGAYGDGSEDVYRLADMVTFPSGVVWTIHYKVFQGQLPVPRIQSVTSSAGFEIKFFYQTDTPGASGWSTRVSAVGINSSVEFCDPDADRCSLAHSWPTVQYGSTGSGLAVTDAGGGVTRYQQGGSYPNSTAFWSVTLPGQTTEAIRYGLGIRYGCPPTDPGNPCTMGSDSRVISATTPDRTTSYNYGSGNTASGTITSTAPGGIVNIYHSDRALNDGSFALTKWTNPLSNVYQFSVDTNGLGLDAKSPELNHMSWQRDGAGNILTETITPKPGWSGALGYHQTFDGCGPNRSACNLPTSVTDARSNTTYFVYNAHQQVVSELDPPNASGARPVKLYEYTDVPAYVRNSSGQLIQSGAPVSMLTKVTVCQTVNGGTSPTCSTDPSAVNTATVFEYPTSASVNALLPRAEVSDYGSGRMNRRTCYGYDDYGNRIWETKPQAGLTSCN